MVKVREQGKRVCEEGGKLRDSLATCLKATSPVSMGTVERRGERGKGAGKGVAGAVVMYATRALFVHCLREDNGERTRALVLTCTAGGEGVA